MTSTATPAASFCGRCSKAEAGRTPSPTASVSIRTAGSRCPRSRAEADQVLRALASDPDAPDIADFESARMLVTMVELRDFASDRPHIRSRRVAALTQHDADHGTRYVETLRAYLDAFGDIPRGAAGQHPPEYVPLPPAAPGRAVRHQPRRPGRAPSRGVGLPARNGLSAGTGAMRPWSPRPPVVGPSTVVRRRRARP